MSPILSTFKIFLSVGKNNCQPAWAAAAPVSCTVFVSIILSGSSFLSRLPKTSEPILLDMLGAIRSKTPNGLSTFSPKRSRKSSISSCQKKNTFATLPKYFKLTIYREENIIQEYLQYCTKGKYYFMLARL